MEGLNRRGRPLGRWKDRINERGTDGWGGLEQARRECLDRERWRLFYLGHPLGGARHQRHY